MSVHHLETYRPGYYAELEAFCAMLELQVEHHKRIHALTADVSARYPGMPTKYLPAMLARMGRHQDAAEVAASIVVIAAESEAELEPDAIQAAAQALLTAHLPDIARIAKEYAR
jgi:hypothetical protein